MFRLVLASQSPYRLELLQQAGFDVQAVATGIEEPDLALFPDLEAGLMCLAEIKARAAARAGVRGLILAADTVSYAGGQVLGKPSDRADALQMLRTLAGTSHEVLTGWCLFRTSDRLLLGGVERTQITLRAWTETEFESYLDSGEWQGKCGAYGLQFPHDPFVTRIEGSVSNVIGVPLERLLEVLVEFPGIASDTG